MKFTLNFRLVTIPLLISLTMAFHPGLKQTPAGAVALHINFPAEGETFYAGPTSVSYYFLVSGSVAGNEIDPRKVVVQLQVIQGMNVVQTLSAQLDDNKAFSFPVTVKPEGGGGTLNLIGKGFVGPGCDVCHYGSVNDLPNELPSGQITLHLEARDPGGRIAMAERRIIVDRSYYLEVPVQVTLETPQDQSLAGIPVIASSWNYMWRGRTATGLTDADGHVIMQVEVLSQSSNDYIFHVDPVAVDGILYESTKPVELTLPAGATSSSLVKIELKASSGQIRGTISGLSTPIPVWAISPDGSAEKAEVTPDGIFTIINTRVAPYYLTADPLALAGEGLTMQPKFIDLSQAPSQEVTLSPQLLEGNASLTGKITDEAGMVLPFAWVSARNQFSKTTPALGKYSLFGLPLDVKTILVNAPGYYSQEWVPGQYDEGSNTSHDFSLARIPSTQVLPWGEGKIILPQDTIASAEGLYIAFTQGWLWGYGESGEPLEIQVDDLKITLPAGKFALERLAEGKPWFYLLEGEASISKSGQVSVVHMEAGEIALLSSSQTPRPVPYNEIAIQALRFENGTQIPLKTIWKPGLSARFQHFLASLGIGTAQAVTFITYLMEILALFAVVVFVVNWAVRRLLRGNHRD